MTKELCLITNRHEPPARACLPNNQMEVLMKKLLKLPLRIATLPIIAMLLVFQLISSRNCWIDLHRNRPACNGIPHRLCCRVDCQRSQRPDLPDGGAWYLLRLCSAHRWMVVREGNRPYARSAGLPADLIIKACCSLCSYTQQNRTANALFQGLLKHPGECQAWIQTGQCPFPWR